MIHEVDQALRKLLIRELPVKSNEIDIVFEQPKREWSARVNRPTLNLYLHDLRENNKLRQPQWDITQNQDGTVTRRRSHIRVDLHYMITAWTADPEDEHRLLTRTLMALYRCPNLPEDLMSNGLEEQPLPVPIEVAQYDELRDLVDTWSSLDNELRPVISCVITIALNPYEAITEPLISTRDLRIGQSPGGASGRRVEEGVGQEQYWTISGVVNTDLDLDKVRITLVERGLDLAIQPETRRFFASKLRASDYTLEVTAEGRKSRRYKITVPSPDYDLEI